METLTSGIRDVEDSALEFTALFVAAAVVMLVAWRGRRDLAIILCLVALAACTATFLHHATDTLKLSF